MFPLSRKRCFPAFHNDIHLFMPQEKFIKLNSHQLPNEFPGIKKFRCCVYLKIKKTGKINVSAKFFLHSTQFGNDSREMKRAVYNKFRGFLPLTQ